ncbi:MAG: MurR/RpiR family transcriptional regulator [Victivallaceae bacterium]|nr:MurR/RpiR family transcriptional regulator [Victivallaceae bacterium]
MNITPKCILQIKRLYPELTGKYKDIADYILANPEKIIRHKVKDIAGDCNCDDALIIRFCQKIGYSGFSEFKMSIATGFLPVRLDIADKEFSPEYSFLKLKRNFLDNNLKALHDTLGHLEEETIKQAVQILSRATKIYLFASGNSGIVAEDIEIKLMRLGFNAIFHQDAEFSKIFMGLCNPDDAILAISFSGETASVCGLAAIAGKKGVPVIAITNYPNSRLTGLADVTLLTASDEKIFRLGPMTSRIAQYYIIDFLIINLALENMERAEEYIVRTHEMIRKDK